MESGTNSIKVLWFTNSSSRYENGNHKYNGCGWIESLEELVAKENDIELAISFFHSSDREKLKSNNVTYYPILNKRGKKRPLQALFNHWRVKDIREDYIPNFLKVIDDFKPDIIHIFGTESVFGLLTQFTNIPIVIHLQGLINPYLDAFFPVGVSKLDFIFSKHYFFQNLMGLSPLFTSRSYLKFASREASMLRSCNYVMGRTEWDKTIATFYNSRVKYFHVNEVLRAVFYNDVEKGQLVNKKLSIVSTLSPTIYKGLDTILKTASLLMKIGFVDFEWNVIGVTENDKLLNFFERKFNLNHSNLNIKMVGKLNAECIRNRFKEADVFVHPSYIDNSPNSVCEAQILGLPVIACNVGGLSSLIEDNVTGKLIPSNGIHELASLLSSFNDNKSSFLRFADKGKKVAYERHKKETILNDVLSAYLYIHRSKL